MLGFSVQSFCRKTVLSAELFTSYVPVVINLQCTHFQKAKLLKQKKEEGNADFRAGRLQSARKIYTEALEVDPLNIFTNSKLYCNRAAVLVKVTSFYLIFH